MAHGHAVGDPHSERCGSCRDLHDESILRRLRAELAAFIEQPIPPTLSLRQGAPAHPAGQPDVTILCPQCLAARIVTSANRYFCDRYGHGCGWALPVRVTDRADLEILRLIRGGIQ